MAASAKKIKLQKAVDENKIINISKVKNDEEFPTDWDIDGYRTECESEEHWDLRKRFMEVHKDRFPEERLVCLARVFTNMEFLGCRYPSETMHLVAELSKEVAKEFREKRETRLKRTFVAASDAAEQRAKARRTNPQHSAQQQATAHKVKGNSRTSFADFDLFKDLPFGKFVLYLFGGRSCLHVSAQRSDIKYSEKEEVLNENLKKLSIFLGDQLVAIGTNTKIKIAKAEAFNEAVTILQKQCYSIQPKQHADKIKIEKTADNKVICCILKQEDNGQKLDESNKGFKMMQLMGWSGKGLGSLQQGREEPVNFLLRNHRAGLGNESCTLDHKYFTQMLDNYVKSEDIRELRFEPSFSKEERATLHQIANKFNLKSNSYGKDEKRHLIISKKTISNKKILNEILINKNSSYSAQYLVQVPECKAKQFPEHTAHLKLEINLPPPN